MPKKRKKLGQYLVYRTGSMAIDNRPWVPVAIVTADSADDAVRTMCGKNGPKLTAKIVASVGNIEVSANQVLRALSARKASIHDWYYVRAQAHLLKRRSEAKITEQSERKRA